LLLLCTETTAETGAYLSGIREARLVHAMFDPVARKPDELAAPEHVAAYNAGKSLSMCYTTTLFFNTVA
jgi:hypothetical protein